MFPAISKLLLPGAILAGALTAIGFIAYQVYQAGAASVQAQWDVERERLAAEHDKEVARLESINRKVTVKYLYRDRYIEGQTKTIIKEVPKYVTVEDDSRCDIPDGFMLVRHAAIEGHVPGDYRRSDFVGTGATVALSELSANDAENYGACHRNAAQLNALVDVVKQQMQGR